MNERFTLAEVDLFRQWFNAVDDLNPLHHIAEDRDLYKKLKRILTEHRRGKITDFDPLHKINKVGKLAELGSRITMLDELICRVDVQVNRFGGFKESG